MKRVTKIFKLTTNWLPHFLSSITFSLTMGLIAAYPVNALLLGLGYQRRNSESEKDGIKRVKYFCEII